MNNLALRRFFGLAQTLEPECLGSKSQFPLGIGQFPHPLYVSLFSTTNWNNNSVHLKEWRLNPIKKKKRCKVHSQHHDFLKQMKKKKNILRF